VGEGSGESNGGLWLRVVLVGGVTGWSRTWKWEWRRRWRWSSVDGGRGGEGWDVVMEEDVGPKLCWVGVAAWE
jgi:hypothetical protein